MNFAQTILVNHLADGHKPAPQALRAKFSDLNPAETAQLFVYTALLSTSMQFIKEQLWLSQRQNQSEAYQDSYDEFLTPYFKNELLRLAFLSEFLTDCGPEGIATVAAKAKALEERLLELMQQAESERKKEFLRQALSEMSEIFLEEETRQQGRSLAQGHLGPCLYRCFDQLDRILALDYQIDKTMIRDWDPKERLYQGSGATVQSGYSTILLALQHIELNPGAKFIDLGSGYGRVGLVLALVRPDVYGIGYEFVPHRVDNANTSSRMLGLQERLAFHVQDLSLPSFQIPDADVYYLYDPFTEETYQHVLSQIVEISTRQQLTIITKGNARDWLHKVATKYAWPSPQSIDEGNLCIFQSR